MMIQTLTAAAVVVAVLMSLSKRSEDGMESMNRHLLERGRKRGLIQGTEDGVMMTAMIVGENIKKSQRRRHPIDIENETMKQKRGIRRTVRVAVRNEDTEMRWHCFELATSYKIY